MATLMSDTFTGSDGTAWSTSNWTTNGTGTGGAATILSNAGKMASGTAGSYGSTTPTMRSANITSPTDVIISGTWKPDANEPYGSVHARAVTSGADQVSGYILLLNKNGTITLIQSTSYGGAGSATLGSFSFSASSNTTYGFKLSCVGSTIRCKVWSGSEPGTWNVSVTDTVWTGAGKVGLRVAGGGAAVQHIITFDDIVVDDGTSGVTITPTAVSCSTSVPTQTKSAGSNVAATALATTTTIPSSTPHSSIALATTAISSSTSTPTVELTASTGVSLTAVHGIVAVPATSLAAGQGSMVQPSPVLASSQMMAPACVAGIQVSATAMMTSATVPDPTVAYELIVEVVAAIATTSVFTPVARAGTSIVATVVTNGSTMATPTVSNEVALGLVAISPLTTQIPAMSLHAGVSLTPIVVMAQGSTPNTEVAVSSMLSLQAVLGFTQITTPTISQDSSASGRVVRALAVIPVAMIRALSTKSPDGTARGGWGTLISILDQGRALAATDYLHEFIACPDDGTPLRLGGDGILYCPWDGWRPGS